MLIHIEDITRVSFSDSLVSDALFEPSRRRLVLIVEGAYLEKGGSDKAELRRGELSFQDWERFEVRSYDASRDIWHTLDDEEFDRLKAICDFEVNGKVIYLRGFGVKTDLWLEYKLTASKHYFEFRIDVQQGQLNDIGKALKKHLEMGYDIEKISRWAFQWYSDSIRELNSSEKDVLRLLFTMEEGPEFQYSKKDLYRLAEYLIEGIPNAIGKLNRKESD